MGILTNYGDFDGNYTIKPIDPGSYTVKATFVGCGTVEITKVVISANKTTFECTIKKVLP